MVDEIDEMDNEDEGEELATKENEPEPLTSQGFSAKGEVELATFSFFVDSITALTDEANWHFEKDGIKIKQMDPSQIAMVVTELNPAGYYVSEPRAVGVNMKDLARITSRLKDKVSFSIDADMKMTIKSKATTWKIPLFEATSMTPMKEPKVEGLQGLKERTAAEVSGLLKDAGLMSSHIRFHDVDGKLVVSSESDTGNADLYLDDKVEKVDSMYPLSFFMKLIPKGTQTVVISLATDKPVRVEAKVSYGVQAVYWLAPRIQ